MRVLNKGLTTRNLLSQPSMIMRKDITGDRPPTQPITQDKTVTSVSQPISNEPVRNVKEKLAANATEDPLLKLFFLIDAGN
jgi:hypothetical protein